MAFFQRLLIKVLSKPILLLLIFTSTTMRSECRPLSCAADKYADGCSVPSMVPAPFKNEFTRACNRHDICYGCVSLTKDIISRVVDEVKAKFQFYYSATI